jgi:hypothetical protein
MPLEAEIGYDRWRLMTGPESALEQHNLFVSSRGILRSCDVRDPTPNSSHPDIALFDYGNLRPGCSIYVCQDALTLFSGSILDNIRVPFVLVSGDSDLPLTKQLPGFEKIVQNPHLLAWYAQNLKAHSKKIHPLPIGLDYHAVWERPGHFEPERISPADQEAMLRATLAASKPLKDRIPQAYCNWHFSMHGNRQECRSKVAAAACHYEPVPIPRRQTWSTQAEFMFVLSPEGAGMDCHRTWEAILLGAIPIVNQNAITPLFKRLPVIVVENWAQVTPQFLEKSYRKIENRKFAFSSLFLRYWTDKFRNRPTDQAFDGLSFEDFAGRVAALKP